MFIDMSLEAAETRTNEGLDSKVLSVVLFAFQLVVLEPVLVVPVLLSGISSIQDLWR